MPSGEREVVRRAGLAGRARQLPVAGEARDLERAGEIADTREGDADAALGDRLRRRVGTVEDAVVVAVAVERIGAGTQLGAVVEAVAVGVGLRRAGPVGVDLRPVAEVVAVGVRRERVRGRKLLPGGREPVQIEILGGVARSVAIRVGLRRMVRELGDEDLEAIGQPVAIGVADAADRIRPAARARRARRRRPGRRCRRS